MLTKSSISAAYPLATLLTQQGSILFPSIESPLSLLTRRTIDGLAVFEAEGEGFVAPALDQQIETATSVASNIDGSSPHDEVMDESIKLLTKSVSFVLNHTRNVVLPMIKKAAIEMLADILESANGDLAPLDIVPYYFKPLWNSPVFQDLVNRYSGISTPVVKFRGGAIECDCGEDYAQLLLTGAGSFDDEVREFARDVGAERIKAVWDAIFGGQATSSDAVLGSRYDRFDTNAIAFLMARRMTMDVPAGVDMGLSEWKDYVASIVQAAGVACINAYRTRDLDMGSNRLIISAPVGDEPRGSVIVVGDVYDRFLKDGGSPEIIFGALYSNEPRTYSALLSQGEFHAKVWKRIYSLHRTNLSFERYRAMIEGLRLAVSKAITEMAEDELPATRAELQNRLNERLTHVKQKDMEDIYHVARKAICRVIFPHTDAEKMLLAIDAAAEANPDLDPREAALMATIEYVSQWLASLIQVDKVA